MEGPGQLVSLLAVYFLLVRVVGPHLMQNRPAMQLKSVITTYNTVQVLACAIVVQQVKFISDTTCPIRPIKSWRVSWKLTNLLQTIKYIQTNNVTVIGCGAVDYSDNPNAVQV